MRDYIGIAEAASQARVSPQAMRKWAARIDGLAVRVVGRWRISPEALRRVLEGVEGGQHIVERQH
jgi:hypothetical protein